jgi:hypothetical protein
MAVIFSDSGSIEMIYFYPRVVERMLDIGAGLKKGEIDIFNWSPDGNSKSYPFRIERTKRGDVVISCHPVKKSRLATTKGVKRIPARKPTVTTKKNKKMVV